MRVSITRADAQLSDAVASPCPDGAVGPERQATVIVTPDGDAISQHPLSPRPHHLLGCYGAHPAVAHLPQPLASPCPARAIRLHRQAMAITIAIARRDGDDIGQKALPVRT